MLITYFFLVGLTLGSFMNLLVYRIIIGKSLITKSACPCCGKEISYKYNIPVIGWIILKGKAKCCGNKISIQYPLIELLFGLFSIYYFWDFSFELGSKEIFSYISGYVMFFSLLALSLIDFKIKEVPISLLILSFVGAVGYSFNVESALVVLGAGYMIKLMYEYIRGIEVLGEGDLPVLAIFGALFGIDMYLAYGLFLTSFFGVLFAIYFKIKLKENYIPLIPSISLSIFCLFIFSDIM